MLEPKAQMYVSARYELWLERVLKYSWVVTKKLLYLKNTK